MNYDGRQFGNFPEKTPIIGTPNVFPGGRSMHAMNSPMFYGGGAGTKSPLFTPMRSYHKQEFTQ